MVESDPSEQEAPAQGAPLLTVSGITASYPGSKEQVLRNVTVELRPGQTLAVVGESGSGKSSLARVITGLLPPSAGKVEFNSRLLSPALADRSKDDLRELQMIH